MCQYEPLFTRYIKVSEYILWHKYVVMCFSMQRKVNWYDKLIIVRIIDLVLSVIFTYRNVYSFWSLSVMNSNVSASLLFSKFTKGKISFFSPLFQKFHSGLWLPCLTLPNFYIPVINFPIITNTWKIKFTPPSPKFKYIRKCVLFMI